MNLIIGANGFIGQHLHEYFRDNQEPVHGTFFPASAGDSHLSFFDVTKPLADQLKHVPPFQRVFLCLQQGTLDDCKRSPTSTSAINVRGLIRLLKYLQQHGGQPIYLSSNVVFAGRHARYHEQSRLNPNTEYGRQKAAVEKYIRRHFRQYCIARLTKVYNTDATDTYLFYQWLQLLRRGRSIRAVTDQVISPIWVTDVARSLSLLDPTEQPGIYHFTGPDSGSPADYAERLARHFHLNTGLIEKRVSKDFTWLEERPRWQVLDDRATRRRLPVRPATIESAFAQQSYASQVPHDMLLT
ncbi:MAG TPA: sugar nucleotide-binding protein [Candidatus Andersenbacteria bacterium]|nr:MAG: hypothetical protein A2854_02145 [Parcubacteria group bacterium RIFCSPHIGHO2_01_FULL_56_18]HLD25624.1 sugar nucleotide-binding protein [Candidatus Andersenbacteria bacterium]